MMCNMFFLYSYCLFIFYNYFRHISFITNVTEIVIFYNYFSHIRYKANVT